MLTLTVKNPERFDDETNEFYEETETVLQLEHSLVSLSKWEEFFEKPFLGKREMTTEETQKYIECMILTPDFPPEVVLSMSQENLDEITRYINAKHTATWFGEDNSPQSREVITNELIYYWMITAGIPKECENWHLSRLFTLLRVFSSKNSKPKPVSKADQAKQRRELNAARQKKLGTTG